jgi:ubiquinone/menaquinone biosynthesis C-methylase UbiE
MVAKLKSSKTQSFYDRIADVHNIALRINGYKKSVSKYLSSLDLGIDSDSLVLDAGSGTGIVTLGFYGSKFRPRRTVTLDLSYNSLDVSRDQFRKDKTTNADEISAVQGNVLKLPFEDETFDLILTCGVLEYVPLDDGLKEMARVLKKGGKLVMIPIKPSIVGKVLEILYSFKKIPMKTLRKTSEQYFKIVGNYKFPITEPMGWSKMIFLLEKK